MNSRSQENILIEEHVVERINKLCYLGRTMTIGSLSAPACVEMERNSKGYQITTVSQQYYHCASEGL